MKKDLKKPQKKFARKANYVMAYVGDGCTNVVCW